MTGIGTELDSLSWFMLPYSWSCHADIVDGSGHGRGTEDICRQLKDSDLLRQQNVTKDFDGCRTRFIFNTSVHRQTACCAITASREIVTRLLFKIKRSADSVHHILSLTANSITHSTKSHYT